MADQRGAPPSPAPATSKPKPTPAQRLDIEDDEERERRLNTIFERLNTRGNNSSSSTPPAAASGGMPKFDFGDRTTFEVKPNSELLSRIQSFLPQLAASNEELLRRAEVDPEAVDIEHITEGSEKVIQMDLGLGLFEERKGKSSNEADDEDEDEEDLSMSDDDDSSSSSSSESDSSSSDPDSDPDSYSDSDASSSSSDVIITGPAIVDPNRPVRPLPKRHASTASGNANQVGGGVLEFVSGSLQSATPTPTPAMTTTTTGTTTSGASAVSRAPKIVVLGEGDSDDGSAMMVTRD